MASEGIFLEEGGVNRALSSAPQAHEWKKKCSMSKSMNDDSWSIKLIFAWYGITLMEVNCNGLGEKNCNNQVNCLKIFLWTSYPQQKGYSLFFPAQ